MTNTMIGLQVTVFGLGAVFVALSVLATLLTLMDKVLTQNKVKSAVQVQPAKSEVSVQKEEGTNIQQRTSPENELAETELVAIITAAVTQMMASECGYMPQIRITSIAPAPDAWRMRGRGNLVSTRPTK